MIYLDNAATTQIAPEVLDAMMPYLTEEFGNAGSLHSLGRRAADAIAKARKQVADCIGAKPEQIIFTSGGTEANNLVFKGLAPYLKSQNKTHIITSKIEHDSVLNTVKEMNIKHGFDVSYLDVTNKDRVPIEIDRGIQEVINENTGIVSVMYVNNETGLVNNVLQACVSAHTNGVLFHTDGVQALGSIEIDVDKLGCDFLSISSHKIHGAKGTGALYVRNPELLSSLLTGGEEQEFGYRGGTENVAGIVGFGKACELISLNFEQNRNRVQYLKKLFYDVLLHNLTECGLGMSLHLNGTSPYHNGKILNLRFEDVDAQTLVLYLDANGVCVSAGSACRSHESEPSNTLLAIGLTPDEARSSVRFSFSHYLTDEQVFEAAKITAYAVQVLGDELNG